MSADAMSERQLQNAILDLCRHLQLLAYHTHDSRRSQPGFPDLVVVGSSGVLFAELKTASNQLTPQQTQWIGALRMAGQTAHVWRPADLRSGAITAELTAIAKQAVAS